MWWYFTFNTLPYFHSFKRYFNCLDLCQTHIHHWHRKNWYFSPPPSSDLLTDWVPVVNSRKPPSIWGRRCHGTLCFSLSVPGLKNSVFGEKWDIIQLLITVGNPMYFGRCHWLHSREISTSVIGTWITCCIYPVLDREMIMSCPRLKFFLQINSWRLIFGRKWKCVDCIIIPLLKFELGKWMIICCKK